MVEPISCSSSSSNWLERTSQGQDHTSGRLENNLPQIKSLGSSLSSSNCLVRASQWKDHTLCRLENNEFDRSQEVLVVVEHHLHLPTGWTELPMGRITLQAGWKQSTWGIILSWQNPQHLHFPLPTGLTELPMGRITLLVRGKMMKVTVCDGKRELSWQNPQPLHLPLPTGYTELPMGRKTLQAKSENNQPVGSHCLGRILDLFTLLFQLV